MSTATETYNTPQQTHAAPVADSLQLTTAAAKRLRQQTVGLRLKLAHLPTTKALSAEQKRQIAAQFGAEAEAVSATKKLLDTRHPKYKAVTKALARIKRHWRDATVPYIEAGIRLLPWSKMAEYDAEHQKLVGTLTAAVLELEQVYASELIPQRQSVMGELFDAQDYLSTLEGAWGAQRDYMSLDPPDFLKTLAPKIYEEQVARLTASLTQSVEKAEQAFATQLAEMLQGLVERLTPESGKKKVIQQRGLDSLKEFIIRYKDLQFATGSGQLEQLMETVEAATANQTAKDLRTSVHAQQEMREAAQAALRQAALLITDQARAIRFSEPAATEEPAPAPDTTADEAGLYGLGFTGVGSRGVGLVRLVGLLLAHQPQAPAALPARAGPDDADQQAGLRLLRRASVPASRRAHGAEVGAVLRPPAAVERGGGPGARGGRGAAAGRHGAAAGEAGTISEPSGSADRGTEGMVNQ